MSFALRRLTTIASHLSRPALQPTLTSFKLGSSLSTQSSPAMSANAKSLVDQAIKDNKILIFSKTYCPYCKKAKNALKDEGEAKVYELDERDDGDEIQNYLAQLTGGRSVPRVFLGGKFVGGGDDVAAMSKSKIRELIA